MDDQGNVSYHRCYSDEVDKFRSFLQSGTIEVLPPVENATVQQLAEEHFKVCFICLI